jgi:hypothetical protein
LPVALAVQSDHAYAKMASHTQCMAAAIHLQHRAVAYALESSLRTNLSKITYPPRSSQLSSRAPIGPLPLPRVYMRSRESLLVHLIQAYRAQPRESQRCRPMREVEPRGEATDPPRRIHGCAVVPFPTRCVGASQDREEGDRGLPVRLESREPRAIRELHCWTMECYG